MDPPDGRQWGIHAASSEPPAAPFLNFLRRSLIPPNISSIGFRVFASDKNGLNIDTAYLEHLTLLWPSNSLCSIFPRAAGRSQQPPTLLLTFLPVGGGLV